MRDVLLIRSGDDDGFAEWQAEFARAAPELETRPWGDPALDPAAVTHALVWEPEPGLLARLPNLRVIFSAGAGVDSIVADPELPLQVPLVRMGVAGAAQRMGEYVVWAALSLLKEARAMALAQQAHAWHEMPPSLSASDRRVGIMGLGIMGRRSAEMLVALGFPVAGWSRTPKAIPGVACFQGEAERDAFLARSDILVVLLPATAETEGLIAAPLLARLPQGAALILVGRGSQTVLDDVLAALDAGRLSGLVCDVFATEPLPSDHPVWAHPHVIVTPHCASQPSRAERAAFVAEAIARHRRGEALPHLYDHARGY